MTPQSFADFGITIPSNPSSDNIKTTCPHCAELGKKHTKDKCLSVNITKGIWNCHKCGWSGHLPIPMKDVTFYTPQRTYDKPKRIGNPNLSPKALQYLEGTRCIPADVLERYHITEGEASVISKDTGEWVKRNCIHFNYYLNGEHINTKFRSGLKEFAMIPKCRIVPYNIDAVFGKKKAIVTEGECFRGDTEILTERGFIPFSEYDNEYVAAVDDNLNILWQSPQAIIRKPFSGNLIHLYSRFYNMLTTPGHNIVLQHCYKGHLLKKTAQEIHDSKIIAYNIPISAKGNDNIDCVPLTDDEIRLEVAFSADWTFRRSGDMYGAFKKERKIERMMHLLESCGIPYSYNIDGRGYASFFIRRGNKPQWSSKFFNKEWIGSLSRHQIGVFLDEIIHWDGNSVPNRNEIEYSSKLIHNISFVQALAHIYGYSANYLKKRNPYGEWYRLLICKDRDHYNTQALKKELIPYEGTVYCVQVSTGRIIVRHEGRVSIVGNCDTLSFIAAGYDNDSCGVCSVPNGANSAKCFDDFIDTHFDDKEIIYIASDMDAPGIALREELLRRFGKENCKVITYGEGFKDANELLCAKGIGALIEAVNNAQDFPSDDVVTVDHLSDNLDVLFNEGLHIGKTIGIPAFDELISFETKRLCIVTGIPTMGKSTFLDEMCVRFSLNYGWRTAFFSPENEPLQLHMSKLISRICGRKFDNKHITPQQYQRTKNYVAENFSWIKPQESYTLTNILKAAKWLVRRKGIKVLVIDPYNRVESEGNSAETETKYISTMLDRLTNFAQQYDVLVCLMAHPRKMPKDTNGKLEIPTMYDINGSANFYNKADFGIVVHRDKEQGVTIVKVDKVKFRHLGQGGRCNLYFNINNERYTDTMDYDNSDWLVNRQKNTPEPVYLDGFSYTPDEIQSAFNSQEGAVPF